MSSSASLSAPLRSKKPRSCPIRVAVPLLEPVYRVEIIWNPPDSGVVWLSHRRPSTQVTMLPSVKIPASNLSQSGLRDIEPPRWK